MHIFLFALPHFKAGTLEVHLVFELFNPTQFEHTKRYSKTNSNHQHYAFSPHSTIPSNSSQEYLQCQQCNRGIVESVGIALLQRGCYLLGGQQQLVLAGCFTGSNENSAWLLNPGRGTAEQAEKYYSTSAEADTRIWRHATE